MRDRPGNDLETGARAKSERHHPVNIQTESGSLEIRSALACDVPVLADLLEELGFPSSPGEVAKRLTAMPDAALVALRRGHVVGLITTNVMPVLHRPTAVGRLSALVVAKPERRRGVGRALVAAAERRLEKQGCELAEVTSNFRLQEAHSFYERLGYEATSFRFKKALGDAEPGTPADHPAAASLRV